MTRVRRGRDLGLYLLEGGKRPEKMERLVTPRTPFPDPPSWMQPEAQKLYTETTRRLEELQIASEVDTELVISYVMGAMMLRECERKVSNVGLAKSRCARLWQATNLRWMDMAKQLGLTPAARTGMRLKPAEPIAPEKQLFG